MSKKKKYAQLLKLELETKRDICADSSWIDYHATKAKKEGAVPNVFIYNRWAQLEALQQLVNVAMALTGYAKAITLHLNATECDEFLTWKVNGTYIPGVEITDLEPYMMTLVGLNQFEENPED